MSVLLRICQILSIALLIAGAIYGLLSTRTKPESVTYGMSFNTPYARELGLDWKETYDAVLADLNVKHLRLAAHWPMIEPEDDQFNFSELDYQIEAAKARDADVILSVGRRLPRWPECHVPPWAEKLPWETQKAEILEQIAEVVTRYKDEAHIIYWQVENEPFLTIFASEQCGSSLDETFLDEEIALVRLLDPDTPILVTDSGNLGAWAGAYQRGDAFGTSVYVYFWNPDVGPFRSILPPSFYRFKAGLMEQLHGEKPIFLIELSAEPWLLQPVVDTPLVTQLKRMDMVKFENIIEYAESTHFDRQYLWGAEWWYWLKNHGHDSFWERGKRLFE